MEVVDFTLLLPREVVEGLHEAGFSDHEIEYAAILGIGTWMQLVDRDGSLEELHEDLDLAKNAVVSRS